MVAIYARQSVDKKDSISIETQIELCRREIDGAQKHCVYSDKGYSGSSLKRPEFQHLLDDVKAGRIERIITYRLDRISRSVLDFANLIDLFDRYGVTFNSTQEKFDTNTPMGKAMLNITMVFAQLERETIQQRIRDNYYSRAEKGMYLGGPPPFGFCKTEVDTEHGKLKMLCEDGKTAPVLTDIFTMYGNELRTLGEIARALNGRAVPSPNGKTWDSSKISRILRNPVYVKANANVYIYYRKRGCKFTNEISDFSLDKGCYLYGKREAHERKYTDVSDHTISLAPHEGLVSTELFLSCQKRLDKNLQIDNKRRSKITWLTGLIKCKSCGYSIIPKTSNGGRYIYLYCTGRQVMGACEVPGNLGILKNVQTAVESRIFAWAKKYAHLKAPAAEPDNREKNLILCRQEEISQAIERLIELAVASNGITVEYLNSKMSELEVERRELDEKLEQCGGKAQESSSLEIADLPSAWAGLDTAFKNAIASLLVSRINITQNEIEIEWKYDFNL